MIIAPRGGLGKPTDRDQRSRVLPNNSKKYFANTDRKPRKYFPKSKNLKNTLLNTIHLAKVKHNDEKLCLLIYLVNKTGPKNTVENTKHLEIT